MTKGHLISMILLWMISVSSFAIAIVSLTQQNSPTNKKLQTKQDVQKDLITLLNEFQRDEWPTPNTTAVIADIGKIQNFLTTNATFIIDQCDSLGWKDTPGRPPAKKGLGFLPNPYSLLYGISGFDLNNGAIFTSGNNYLLKPNEPSAIQMNEDITSLLNDMNVGP